MVASLVRVGRWRRWFTSTCRVIGLDSSILCIYHDVHVLATMHIQCKIYTGHTRIVHVRLSVCLLHRSLT